jgi:hypothetical protein
MCLVKAYFTGRCGVPVQPMQISLKRTYKIGSTLQKMERNERIGSRPSKPLGRLAFQTSFTGIRP